ncbi:preprotein translocase subunit SecF [Peribacillus frigoritolerans]|uniref:hypothetical protein n=1 Tax=Peribacillus frigoritolerans TaxID=450367 RepID=UPI0020A2074A|nr:hypothetical protein [Peribacillus frigoritolerans]MCP1495290.1 preprotein translocase subunit SecF [Peribacillus frigoritolerans]
MKKQRKISFWGIIVFGLAIFILYLGIKDYQQQELEINAKYNFQLSLANMSISAESALVAIEQSQFKLEQDPTKKAAIAQEIRARLNTLQLEKKTTKEKLEQQIEEELDGRLFDLLTYFSLSATFLIFGFSLFWRKKDIINMEVQYKSILSNLDKKNHDIEQIKEKLHAQKIALNKENKHLTATYNKQNELSHLLVKKLDEHIKIIEESKKQVATTQEDDLF